jgi:hypothetical protein
MGVASVIKSWALQEVERRAAEPGMGVPVANWRRSALLRSACWMGAT